jgi:PAS domain S-box-containing protein
MVKARRFILRFRYRQPGRRTIEQGKRITCLNITTAGRNREDIVESIRQFFTSPIFADETLSRRAHLLSFIVNLHILIAIGMATLYGVVLKDQWIFPLMALLSCLPALAVRVLIKQGKITAAALIFIGLIAALMPILAFMSNSSVATVSVTSFQFVTIVMAGLLLGGRGAFGFLIFTGLADGLLLYAEVNGWYSIEASASLPETWIIQIITFSAVAIQLWLANRLIQDSFQRALHENEERRAAEASLQLAVDAARLGMWTTDIATGKTNFSNRLTAIYGGQTPDQSFSLVHPQDRERVQQTIANSLSGQQERFVMTHRTMLHDGSERWVDSWGLLSRDRTGKPARLAGVVMDITDRKLAEQEREQLIRELEGRNTELQQFTYTVSHDLKAPLITINGFLSYLEKDTLAGNIEHMKADISHITEATNKMHRLLTELLELSRIGRLMNPPETIPLSDLVHEAMNNVHGQLESGRVTVQTQPDLPAVYGDRQRLVEVLQNLIDNAVKFMGDQPDPRIEIGQRGEDAERGKPVFFVKDNGIGIDSAYHEHIFGLFNKLDPRAEGTGVGLAIVKKIVEVHGGRIWAESEAGKGSTFCFTLGKGDSKS